jgi:hypothetical protein
MFETLVGYAPTVLALLGAVIGVLAVVAPLTQSQRDDDALAFLQKVMNAVGRLVGAQVQK